MTELPTFDPGFTTPEMSAVFSARRRVEAMIEFEVALAAATAEAGLVPPEAAAEIAQACKSLTLDPATIAASTWETGTPLSPLLEAIRAALPEQSAGWVHHGATTQDAVDTALMLQLKEGCAVLERDLTAVAGRLAELAEAHRSHPMMGRTFLQDAVPTTFGMRAAQWLEPVIREVIELRRVAASLPVQLGGPVGNLAPFGPTGPEVAAVLARKLGLVAPVIPWHTDRSYVRAPVRAAEQIAITMGKIGSDLALLAQSDLAEVTMRAGGSSSMAHKRNPIDAVRAVAAASACTTAAAAVGVSTGHELDRGLGSWHLEWWAVPLAIQAGAASVAAVGDCLTSLEVDVERMRGRAGTVDDATLAATTVLIDRVLGWARKAL
ncbi:MAG: lyase family protein [Acidimicrobiia bacterium]